MQEFFLVYLENLMCCTVFFINFPRRSHFPARMLPLAAVSAVGLTLLGRLLSFSDLLVFVYYLIEFCVLLLLFHFCFRTRWEQALCCASAGRATQHLIYQIQQLIGLWVDPSDWLDAGSWPYILGALLSYVPFCLCAYLLYARKIGVSDFDYEKGEFRTQVGLLSAVMVLVCVGITRLVKTSGAQSTTTVVAESLYAIICCQLCLTMLFELNSRAKLTKEMEMVRMLWKEDSKQLAERKDTIELINMKCHDIRHKLEDYHLALTNDEEQEIQSLIQIYDQTYRTGNQTLDVLLADRILLCEKDHIQLSFLGDGTCLNFLTESEVFSLFSNALGNAVEACRKLDESKRQISIIVRSSGDLVSIGVTNYYQGELQFKDDLPVTTRADAGDFHGYGMKSMRAIARKYGGKLKVTGEDGVFNLTIWLMNDHSAKGQPPRAAGVPV